MNPVSEQSLPENMLRDDRTEIARRFTEAAEAWLRRIIQHQLSTVYGLNYLRREDLIKKEIRDHVNQKMIKHPNRFVRDVDATTFEQAIAIVTNPRFYKAHFEEVLKVAFPLGNEHAKIYLDRLKHIRNEVSHGRGCSSRQVEQAICYSNDLIDSIKEYFRSINMRKEYNVPFIVRFCDNRGNEHSMEGVPTDVNSRFIDWRAKGYGDLHPGDLFVAEVEIDPSFNDTGYEVTWSVFGDLELSNRVGTVARFGIKIKHVGEQFELRFRVSTNRDWHRFFNCDDGLGLIYRVLPPL